MKQCPICQTILSVKMNGGFTTCPKCNFLLFIDKNGIKPVDEMDIRQKFYQVNRLVRWACSSILNHQWSDEGYLLSNYDCIKVTVCKWCFIKGTLKREPHEFTEDYFIDASCKKRQVCSKCGQIITSRNPEHSFDDYFVEGTCDRERRCSHCGLVEKLSTEHLFNDTDWVVSDINKCKRTRTCRRCGQEESVVTHSGEWVVIGMKYLTPDDEEIMYQEKRICEVCGFEEYQESFYYSAYHH